LCKSESAPGYNLDDYDHLPFAVYSLSIQGIIDEFQNTKKFSDTNYFTTEPVKVHLSIFVNHEDSSVEISCKSTGGYGTEIYIMYNGRELLNDPDYKPKHVKIDGGRKIWIFWSF